MTGSDKMVYSDKQYDIVIAGGGMTGMTAAITFARCGFSIALVEPARLSSVKKIASFDQRSVALSSASVMIYQSLGIWSELSTYACPIKQILVSNQGHFGFTRLNADDYDYDALGQVICLEEVEPIFWRLLEKEPNVDSFTAMQVASIENNTDECQVIIEPSNNSQSNVQTNKSSTLLKTKLFIAADGTYSELAQQQDIHVSRDPYQQTAFVANVITEKHHANRAYERFTSGGPLALLPLNGSSPNESRMGLVWCHSASKAKEVVNWEDEIFIQQLQQAFGLRLGKITKVSQRLSYPLSLHMAERPFRERFLLLGNAVHTLHPIAGQGFNLGLRDIAHLAEEMIDAVNKHKPFFDEDFLRRFIKKRQPDWHQAILATDGLARLFGHSSLALSSLCNKAMQLVNRFDCLKNHLALSAMGVKHQSSRLVRGLPLPEKIKELDSHG